MKKQLTSLYQNDLFGPIDRHFANYVQEISGNEEYEISLAAALVSWSTRLGNVCLDLNKVTNDTDFKRSISDNSIHLPTINEWINTLSHCSAIGSPGDRSPLVLDSKNRLYFYRYWEYEKIIADAIRFRLESPVEDIDYQILKEGIDRIFDTDSNSEIDMQKIAAFSAVQNRFCVVSGGPGTGKTTNVAKILTLLIEQAGKNEINIILCAPTGKAAASLSDTIRSAKAVIHCDDHVRNMIPDEAFTIHRLLKSIPGSPYFRHNQENPLQADVIIIDEASMVDVALMAKLFVAIPKEARIILVGDKDQLSSVEAGSVLGDICNRELKQNISENTVKWIQQLLNSENKKLPIAQQTHPQMRDHIIVLDKNYRFDQHSGIGGLSKAVNEGDSETCLQLLIDSSDKGIRFHDISDHKTLYKELRKIVIERYSQYLSANDPNHALDLFNQFNILCALKSGPFGVNTINHIVQNILYENNLILFDERESNPLYKGRPVLITRNDYTLGLYNGDTGIIMPHDNRKNKELIAVFPKGKNEFEKVPIHILPEHETVYAMTIHKSQGSEFKDVLIILPDKYYPILTRELIYTGITRAINSVTIWGKEEVLEEAIKHKIERTSGLRDALWN